MTITACARADSEQQKAHGGARRETCAPTGQTQRRRNERGGHWTCQSRAVRCSSSGGQGQQGRAKAGQFGAAVRGGRGSKVQCLAVGASSEIYPPLVLDYESRRGPKGQRPRRPRVAAGALSAYYYFSNYLGNVVILEVIYLLGGGASMKHFLCVCKSSIARHSPSSGQELRPGASQSVGLGGWHDRGGVARARSSGRARRLVRIARSGS